MTTLQWDPDSWRWRDGCRFLNYTTRSGRKIFISKIQGFTHAANKWQGYLLSNYRNHWFQVWDPICSGKEVVFIWSMWHKAMIVNEWKAHTAPASILKQCIFFLPNTSELVKHNFWDCIQAKRTWRWATYIMHELCGVRSDNYNCFNLKQTVLG